MANAASESSGLAHSQSWASTDSAFNGERRVFRATPAAGDRFGAKDDVCVAARLRKHDASQTLEDAANRMITV